MGKLGDEVTVRRDGEKLVTVDGSRQFAVYGEPEWAWWVEVSANGEELPGLWEHREDGAVVCTCE